MKSELVNRLLEELQSRAQEAADAALAFLYRRRRKLLTAAVAVLASWVAYHVIFGANGMVVYAHKRSEYKQVTAEIERIKTENDRLQKENDALKHDPKAIEKEAREQLRYAKPGEVIYTLPNPQRPVTNTAQK